MKQRPYFNIGNAGNYSVINNSNLGIAHELDI